MKKSIFNNTDDHIILHTTHHSEDQIHLRNQAKKTIHTQAVQQHLATIPNYSILNRPPPTVDDTEKQLPRPTRRLLAQIRANKSPLHRIDPITHPSPLCRMADHDTTHLFNCPHIPTVFDPGTLWSNPVGAGT